MNPRFFIATFGCRTNQADSAAIRENFLGSDFLEAGDPSEADFIVLNSCTVTHRSDQQLRQLARKMRRNNPQARVIVTGCYAQRDPARLARIPGIDAVIGNTRKSELVQIVQGFDERTPGSSLVLRDEFEQLRAVDLVPSTVVGGRTRPYVKIQDGCDASCSYCIIPTVRGPGRSVPPEQVLTQVQSLIGAGFQEIVLTGIHIGTYGMHLQPRHPLDQLLHRLVELPGLGQLRLSSIEPMELSTRVVELAACTEKIAPHFHICLQSGSDRILRRMRRPYKAARFLAIVESIRRRLPEAGIGTDLIVGFPGETDEDHRRTLEFIERAPFTYLHVFPYSDRSGTAASSMGGKVPSQIIKNRAEELRLISAEKNARFRSGMVGTTIRFLTLTQRAGPHRQGLSGNYLKVRAPSSVPPNCLIEGRVERAEGDFLVVSGDRSPKWE